MVPLQTLFKAGTPQGLRQLSDAPPAKLEASGSPWREVGLGSNQFDHFKIEKKLWDTDFHRFSQINYFGSA